MEYLKGEQLKDESKVTVFKKKTNDNKNYLIGSIVAVI